MDNKYNILIVDDSRIARMFLSKTIISLGFNVVAEAIDGLDGCNKYQEHKPDLIITDIEMPNMNGIEMIEMIKKLNPNVQAIAVSSVMNTQLTQRILALGVKHFITKPIKEETLKNILINIDK